MEGDEEEVRRVPEFGGEIPGTSATGQEADSLAEPDLAQTSTQTSQRKRGRSPADKEHKRLKRWDLYLKKKNPNFSPILFHWDPI